MRGRPLRILMTNIALKGGSGTETVTRDLAIGYLRAGHEPVIYTRELGRLAELLRSKTIPVTDRTDQLTGTFDVIHAHHLNACIAPAVRWPDCPIVNVTHDMLAWHDDPPHLPAIRRHVAVSDGFARRLTAQAGVPAERIEVILNGVDTDRFRPGEQLPSTPRKALVFAKNAEHVRPVLEACRQRGLSADVVGWQGQQRLDAPEEALGGYDLVFASALAAIESLACLRPTVVCDGRGLAGMVDVSRYERWRRENFGARVLDRPLLVQHLVEEIDRYDPAEAAVVGTRLRAEANLTRWADEYLSVLHDASSADEPGETDDRLALAAHLERWSPTDLPHWPWAAERARLLSEIARLEADLEPLRIGFPLGFSHDGEWPRFARASGFHDPESWGVWCEGDQADIRLAPHVEGRRPLQLEVSYVLPPNLRGSPFRIRIVANGASVADWRHSGRDAVDQRRRLNLPLLNPGESLRLAITTSPPPFPESDAADPRRLGFGLRALTLVSADPG